MKKPYDNLQEVFKSFPVLYGEDSAFQRERYEKLVKSFETFYGGKPYFASSSGRVEVCGNHTDHNGGRVISCAISLDCVAAFKKTDDNIVKVKSEGYDEIIIKLDDKPSEKFGTSAALIRGVIEGLKNYGYEVGGFNAAMTSNVVGGAGISSSASFEVLIAEILSFLYNEDRVTNEEKSKVSQYAESVFFGKPCGLLDQTAIAFGGLNRLDFGNKNRIKVEKINADLSDYTLVLINTGGSHANLTDEYAAIPKEMYSVARVMGKERLIDISESEFYAKLPDVVGKVSDRAIVRAIHFFEENKRVDAIFKTLPTGDYKTFLNSVKNSGISSAINLQNCRVDGSEDQLIIRALAIAENYICGGACRVHGGGFAGTTLNIVKNENLDYFIEKMSAFYDKSAIIPLKVRSVGTIVL
ncbi:MAG: galactokinase family protein [Clostridia bacterium]|nr:galactokinase family protein [Clostridia bacterium]